MSWRVEMVGHASLRIQSKGKTLLTDPWYVDPINCNSIFHWPPLVHDVASLAAGTDGIWISHVHPDHFDPRTLRLFPRSIPIFIGRYGAKGFRDELASLGFRVQEIPFQTPTAILGGAFDISVIESDYGESAAYDSSIVVRAAHFTVFDNNDCFLMPSKYDWVRRNFTIDYGFLGFSPASFYPICFEFGPEIKTKLLREAAERRYVDFLESARILDVGIAVPFAMGIRFLHPSMLWQNVSYNPPQEAVKRARALGRNAEVLAPGDRILEDGSIQRARPEMSEEDEARELRSHADTLRGSIERLWADEKPARKALVQQFRGYVEELWSAWRHKRPEIGKFVIAYRIEGPSGGEFHFDFSREPERIFGDGMPGRYDMRYSYPESLVQLRLDGKIDWDEVNFSNRVSVHQIRYAPEYYEMIRSEIFLPGTVRAARGGGGST